MDTNLIHSLRSTILTSLILELMAIRPSENSNEFNKVVCGNVFPMNVNDGVQRTIMLKNMLKINDPAQHHILKANYKIIDEKKLLHKFQGDIIGIFNKWNDYIDKFKHKLPEALNQCDAEIAKLEEEIVLKNKQKLPY